METHTPFGRQPRFCAIFVARTCVRFFEGRPVAKAECPDLRPLPTEGREPEVRARTCVRFRWETEAQACRPDLRPLPEEYWAFSFLWLA